MKLGKAKKRSTDPIGWRRVRPAMAIGTFIACALLMSLSACSNASNGLNGMSPGQVLMTSVAAARQIGSFHFVDRDGSGTEAQLLVGDAGTIAAQQTLSGGGGRLDVRLADGVVYIRAGQTTLQGVIGLSMAKALTESGKWLSITAKGKGYAQIVQTLKPGSEFNSFIPQAPLSVGSQTKLHGIPVLPVTGSAAPNAALGVMNSRATLFVSTRAPYLPVGGTLTGIDVHGRRQSDQVAFTRWGERIHPARPSKVVTAASLLAG
jgi:hypothetical protein